MNYKFFLMMIFSSCCMFSKNVFMGLSQDGSVKKNNFLCPLSLDASGNVVCQNMDAGMVGFDISGGHTIQIFNNQQYWLQQKFERQHLLIVREYQGDRLSSTMTQEGWDHMGAFSIILTTDPVVLSCVNPEMIAIKGQVKLVAQLWYSASTGLQLWAQDVKLLNAGQNFMVLVSNSSSDLSDDSAITVIQTTPSLPIPAAIPLPSLSDGLTSVASTTKSSIAKSSTTLENFKQQFLEQVGFSPNNIDKNAYNAAYGSPRNIKIQVQ